MINLYDKPRQSSYVKRGRPVSAVSSSPDLTPRQLKVACNNILGRPITLASFIERRYPNTEFTVWEYQHTAKAFPKQAKQLERLGVFCCLACGLLKQSTDQQNVDPHSGDKTYCLTCKPLPK
jgi:hypothetical protein